MHRFIPIKLFIYITRNLKIPLNNTCTIDGRNTFYAMGGVICATPSATNIGTFGFVPLKNFQRGIHAGLKNIKIKDFNG